MIAIAIGIFVLLAIFLFVYANLRTKKAEAGKTKSKEDTQVEKLQQEIELPSRELLLKVKFIGDTKHTVGYRAGYSVGLALKGEFNRFGLYVQQKSLTFYFAGGKHIPKLEFGIWTGTPFIIKNEKGEFLRLRYQVAVRKYKPGDWENNVDLTYKFARAFHDMVEEEKERRKGPPLTDLYPPGSPELAEALGKAMEEARQEDQAIHQLVLQKLRSDTSWQYKNYELSDKSEVQFVR